MKIQEILKQPESKTLEFKKEIPKNRRNLLKTVAAFANGAGGQKPEVRRRKDSGQKSEAGDPQITQITWSRRKGTGKQKSETGK